MNCDGLSFIIDPSVDPFNTAMIADETIDTLSLFQVALNFILGKQQEEIDDRNQLYINFQSPFINSLILLSHLLPSSVLPSFS
jgi:hypothetical protein